MNAQEEFDKEFDKKYGRALFAINEEVRKALRGTKQRGKRYVIFSAYPEDKDGIPVSNLRKVAVKGRCQFVMEDDGFFGNGKRFTSRALSNPTWLRLCVVANRAINHTGDLHHVYLEGVRYIGTRKGVKQYEFMMGS